MPSPVYNNKSLNKPMLGPQKSKIYTNADLKSPDDFQEDDFIEDEIQPKLAADDFIEDEVQPNKPTIVPDNEPGTYWGGVLNSLRRGGEVDKAAGESIRGFLKGAVNLPKTIEGMIDTASSLYNDPVDTIKSIPGGMINGIRDMYKTTRMAGSNPGAFGEMMGEATGQPLVTAGLLKSAPIAMQKTGSIMKNHQPITGMIPRMVEPRIARVVERAVGSGIEKVGGKLRNIGNRPPVSKIEPNMPNTSGYRSGIVNSANEPIDFGPPSVEPMMPNRSGFRPDQILDEGAMDFGPPDIDPRMPNKSGFNPDAVNPNTVMEFDVPNIDHYMPNESSFTGNPMGQAPGAITEGLLNPKPSVRLLPDGNYIRLDTGEIFDSTGKPMAIPSITKDSNFFKRNKKN